MLQLYQNEARVISFSIIYALILCCEYNKSYSPVFFSLYDITYLYPKSFRPPVDVAY